MLEKILNMIPNQYCIIEEDGNIIFPKDKDLLIKLTNILNSPLSDDYFYDNSWYHVVFYDFNFDGSLYKVKFVVDITEKKMLETFLIDSVTHLPIRKVFFDKINSEKGVIVIGDIDYFKKVNDTYGHLIGDKVLEEIGLLLKNSFRDSDVVGRYGGEEFVIFLKDINLDKAYQKIEDIRIKIENTLFTELKIPLTMSFGLSLIDDINESLKNADKALYYAKENGRNKVICFDEYKKKI